ncbi:TPA: hypothetical protein U5E31_001899 [Yersinia enterocolitica]|uniref:hypothetical protein n=1 Tax=Yersinia enterocolitica TaxID=630 RepID=UPI002AC75634|nr:hypothetical protein [Yersinia enterocolitica]HDM8437057.1 hypothetical protein [Yersinia enterocolitica]HEN3601274.1 hypothetical protein [Yersinia enterocolitica]HEN3606799.1 hypothetical protein [Yersinia enterocolitica]HEN3608106.1 hypothetical protein [Yersinia enterocolitica]
MYTEIKQDSVVVRQGECAPEMLVIQVAQGMAVCVWTDASGIPQSAMLVCDSLDVIAADYFADR